MFPTFISILDIQSWWEVPSIAHFCSLFRTAFNLLDFDIEDLEEALLTDGTEETSWLQELIVRLLSGCLQNNEISTFNYQMFLRRLFRQKCQEHDRYNPFNTDVDFTLLPLRTKVDILHALCDFRLDADDVLDQLKNLEADSLRVEPLGYDSNESAYWYFYGTRLYREDFKTKNNKKKSIWQVICFTEDDWFQLTKKFKNSSAKVERSLHHTLSKNFLPELPRLFKEKERQARRRLLESQPKRSSDRLRKLESDLDKEDDKKHSVEDKLETNSVVEEEVINKHNKNNKRYKNKETKESDSENSERRHEMAKSKKNKSRQRKISTGSTSSQENVSASKSKRTKKSDKKSDKSNAKSTTVPAVKPTSVGRQTNNSLSAADGQIVIQPPVVSHKKKLKTSQVFSQTDEDLQVGMHKILEHVKNHEDAWPFADPVEEEYAPNYYSIIRRPMDLQRMEERLDSGYYKNFMKFRSDFQLIVDNCRLYNGAENEYTEMVDTLLQVFDKATEKYLDQISSSDDEIAVDYANLETETKNSNKKSKKPDVLPPETPPPKTRGRKPALAAQADKKRRERSLSAESSCSEVEEKPKKSKKSEKSSKKEVKEPKPTKSNKSKQDKSNKKSSEQPSKKDASKQQKSESKEPQKSANNSKSKSKNHHHHHHKKSKTKKHQQHELTPEPENHKKPRQKSPISSPIRSDMSSPPPSWPNSPASPDVRFDFAPKKHSKKRKSVELSDVEDSPIPKKAKQKNKDAIQWDEVFEEENKNSNYSPYTPAPLSPKPKDKHNKLRETIEKLKAKSEISRIRTEYDFEMDDNPKENKEQNLKKDKDDNKHKKVKQQSKKDADLEDDGNTSQSDNAGKKSKNKNPTPPSVKPNVKVPSSNLDALSIATEQTLKDINKWLDDTPKFSEFSSASNSPSYIEDFDVLAGNKLPEPVKKVPAPLEKQPGNVAAKKDGGNTSTQSGNVAKQDGAKKSRFRDPGKYFKRKEVQRTIDRLQPGKSKGNLIANVPKDTKTADEIFPLGPLSKTKDTKNSLIVKTDTNAPKLSLGSVLDSFGKHKFVDDPKKEDEIEVKLEESKADVVVNEKVTVMTEQKENISAPKPDIENVDKLEKEPILESEISGGGATPNLSAWFKAFGAPKAPPPQKKIDNKENKESDKENDAKVSTDNKVPLPDPSPSQDSPQPITRQRRISTGSSMSERSSFSQDMDSPRVGMDERGAYPAPYPSPLHRSPSGASPVMASPRPDFSPKSAAYSAFNGQIRVGFYQDTVSNKSSPDKSCSPRDNPQSPYVQYSSEHVYAPNTTHSTMYSYANPPYYTQTPNYSSTNPTPPYNTDASNPSYYDTSKSLTDQYQAAKNVTQTGYNAVSSPASSQNSPATALPQPSPNLVMAQNSPSYHSPSIHSQHSPSVHSQHSPSVHSQHSPSVHSQHSPSVHSQHSPSVHSQHSPSIHSPHPQMSPMQSPLQINPQNSPMNSQQSPINSQHSPAPLNSPVPSQQPPTPQNVANPLPQHSQTSSSEMQYTQQQQEDIMNADSVAANDEKVVNAVFPVKKRAYNDAIDPVTQQQLSAQADMIYRNLQLGQQVSLGGVNVHQSDKPKHVSSGTEFSTKRSVSQTSTNVNYSNTFNNESTNFQLNIPSARSIMSQQTQQQPKLDMSKYTNMGYTGPEINFSRALQQQQQYCNSRSELNYARNNVQQAQTTQQPTTQIMSNPSITPQNYKSMTNTQQAHANSYGTMSTKSVDIIADRLAAQQSQQDAVNIPRGTFNAPPIDVDQPLGLGRNIPNLSNIMDRFSNDERLMAGLQSTAQQYYGDKGLSAPHMFAKTGTSVNAMFSQANMAAMQSYTQSIQQASNAQQMYNRQMSELQGSAANVAQSELKNVAQPEKKSKKRRSAKTAVLSNQQSELHQQQQQAHMTTQQQQQQSHQSHVQQQQQQLPNNPQTAAPAHQGFQSYANLKPAGAPTNLDSAISLKTSSVVPGSAFNFGPTPTGLSLPTSLYGDKESYPNFLEEFRSAPNYFIAAAHHRATPTESSGSDKTPRAHQSASANAQGAGSYPFLNAAHQARPSYPIGGPFMTQSQQQLMDTSSQLYQHYLQAGVLNQGLLGAAAGAYPPGYHPALSMRQPYDSMTRPSWL